MAANPAQIFSRAPDIQWTLGLTVANTAKDLTSGTIYLVFTADATNGGRVSKLVFQPAGSNVATVARIFINNGGVTGPAPNNALIKDLTLPLVTNSEVAAAGNTHVTLDPAHPAGHRTYAT